jgi:hypothetical protein
MYGTPQLKETITITDGTVECPVKGCTTAVERARQGEPLRQPKFLCEQHGIHISPTTFEYADEWDNLLWRDEADRALMSAVKGVKRESRFARDNSEDALTWNVFRYLEKSGRLAEFLGAAIGRPVANAVPVYWSYSSAGKGVCPSLAAAREQFGEAVARSTEPDVIIEADGKVIWIEAKLRSTNETSPSHPADTKGYLSGGERWFEKAFVGDYESIAIAAKRYELMRLWLLGSWAAARDSREFILVNMTRQESSEALFASHIAQLPNAHFLTASWEQFHSWLAAQNINNNDSNRVLQYLSDKGGGYSAGRLRAAFPTLFEAAGV